MEKIKSSVLFRSISLVLIITFIALDISYAYPPEHNAGNSTLAIPSALQQAPINEHTARFQQSVFSQSALIASVYDIGEYFFGNAQKKLGSLPSKYAEDTMKSDLGKHLSDANTEILNIVPVEYIKKTTPEKLKSALDEIGFKGTLPDEGVVFILYRKDGKKFLVQIARKGEVRLENLPGYEWVISDKYVVKYMPENYKASSPLDAAKEEPRATISEPIAQIKAPAPDAGDEQAKPFSIRAILNALTDKMYSINPFAIGFGVVGIASAFSWLKDFAFVHPIATGIVAIGLGIAAVFTIWRTFFTVSTPAVAPKITTRIAKLLIVPAIAITASYFFGGVYVSLFVSSFWKALLATTIIGGITLGSGSYMKQIAIGEPINWNKIWRWATVGAVLLGPVTYGLWFSFLNYLNVSPLSFALIDLCLYATFVFIPLEFLAEKYFVSEGEPRPEKSKILRKYVKTITFNLLWFGPILCLGRTFYPDWVVLIDANAGIIWAPFLVYFIDRQTDLMQDDACKEASHTDIDPFNISEKDISRWDAIQQQVTRDTINNKVTPLIDQSYLSGDEKIQLKNFIQELREISLTDFEKSKKDNPMHHSFIVLEIVLKIAFGEKLQYQNIKELAALAILHDLGYGELRAGKGRVTGGEIKANIASYEAEKKGLTQDERDAREGQIKDMIKDSINARKEHMEKGIPIAIGLLKSLNIELPVIEEICGLVGMHDNPAIAKTYETEEYKPYIQGKAQEYLIGEDRRLALIFREADRLWMLSYEGLIKDLIDMLLKGKKPLSVEKQFANNIKAFTDERKSYDAADGDYGKFHDDTFFRTKTGFEIFQEYCKAWQERINSHITRLEERKKDQAKVPATMENLINALKQLEVFYTSGKGHFKYGPNLERIESELTTQFTIDEQAIVATVLTNVILRTMNDSYGTKVDDLLTQLDKEPIDPAERMSEIKSVLKELSTRRGHEVFINNKLSELEIVFDPKSALKIGFSRSKWQNDTEEALKHCRATFENKNFKVYAGKEYCKVTLFDKKDAIVTVLKNIPGGEVIALGDSAVDISFLALRPANVDYRPYYVGNPEDVSAISSIQTSGYRNMEASYRILKDAVERLEKGEGRLSAIVSDVDDCIVGLGDVLEPRMVDLFRRALLKGVKVYFITGGNISKPARETEKDYYERIVDPIENAIVSNDAIIVNPMTGQGQGMKMNAARDTSSVLTWSEDTFEKLYIDEARGDISNRDRMLEFIEAIDVKLYNERIRPILGAIERGSERALPILELEKSGILEKALPFLSLASKQHTLEVFDAFNNIALLNSETYNEHRKNTHAGVEGEGKVEEITLSSYKRLKELLDDVFASQDAKKIELLFLLPLIHDVGKAVIEKGHPEIGARYFVRPILEKLGFDEASITLAQKIVEKHVDLATVITTERTPDYARSGLEGNQDAMTILALLTAADRSYGSRADAMTPDIFASYFEWGDFESENWKLKYDWQYKRVTNYLKGKSDADVKTIINEMVKDEIVGANDIAVFDKYMGSKIAVFDYGNVVFKEFAKKDASGKALLKLYIVLSKIAAARDALEGNDIFRINLDKDPIWRTCLYEAIDVVDAGQSSAKIEMSLSKYGISFNVRGGKFLDVKIDLKKPDSKTDDLSQLKTTQAPKTLQLFEIVESSLSSERAKFIEEGKKIAPDIDKNMATAEIRQRIENAVTAIETLGKEGITPEAKAGIELLRKNLPQFEADGAVGSLIALARRAKNAEKESQKLIIGLETDWIPGIQVKGSLQKNAMSALMREIDSIGEALRSMGLDNVEIVHESGSQLADSLTKIASDSHTDMRNIVVMASKDTITSDSFKVFRDVDEKNKPFLTSIDPTELIKLYDQYGDSSSYQLHIKLTTLLYMTLEVASGKEPPKASWIQYDNVTRLLMLTPGAEIKDYQALKDAIKGEIIALQNA